MKTFSWLIVAVFAASPAFAAGSEQGYVEATGGLQGSAASTFTGWSRTGSGGTQIGVRAAPHLFVIGEIGKFRSLQPAAVQQALDGTVSDLSSSMGLDVSGQAKERASYGFGGVRLQGTVMHHVAPYAMVGIGAAHLVPTATLAFTDGILPGADPTALPPDVGSDVTPQLVSAGAFTEPSSSKALMFSSSAGITVGVAKHVTADVGYRLSRVNATTPITIQGVVVGVGLRF